MIEIIISSKPGSRRGQSINGAGGKRRAGVLELGKGLREARCVLHCCCNNAVLRARGA